jgi:hypothetical protein
MKSKLAYLALVLVCLWGRTASADTITSGNLSFTNLNVQGTTPTGSFIYDNSTKQFVQFTVLWDGFIWGMNGLGPDNFNALMGIGPNEQKFNMYCIGGGCSGGRSIPATTAVRSWTCS